MSAQADASRLFVHYPGHDEPYPLTDYLDRGKMGEVYRLEIMESSKPVQKAVKIALPNVDTERRRELDEQLLKEQKVMAAIHEAYESPKFYSAEDRTDTAPLLTATIGTLEDSLVPEDSYRALFMDYIHHEPATQFSAQVSAWLNEDNPAGEIRFWEETARYLKLLQAVQKAGYSVQDRKTDDLRVQRVGKDKQIKRLVVLDWGLVENAANLINDLQIFVLRWYPLITGMPLSVQDLLDDFDNLRWQGSLSTGGQRIFRHLIESNVFQANLSNRGSYSSDAQRASKRVESAQTLLDDTLSRINAWINFLQNPGNDLSRFDYLQRDFSADDIAAIKSVYNSSVKASSSAVGFRGTEQSASVLPLPFQSLTLDTNDYESLLNAIKTPPDWQKAEGICLRLRANDRTTGYQALVINYLLALIRYRKSQLAKPEEMTDGERTVLLQAMQVACRISYLLADDQTINQNKLWSPVIFARDYWKAARVETTNNDKDEEKINQIEENLANILESLNFELNNDHAQPVSFKPDESLENTLFEYILPDNTPLDIKAIMQLQNGLRGEVAFWQMIYENDILGTGRSFVMYCYSLLTGLPVNRAVLDDVLLQKMQDVRELPWKKTISVGGQLLLQQIYRQTSADTLKNRVQKWSERLNETIQNENISRDSLQDIFETDDVQMVYYDLLETINPAQLRREYAIEYAQLDTRYQRLKLQRERGKQNIRDEYHDMQHSNQPERLKPYYELWVDFFEIVEKADPSQNLDELYEIRHQLFDFYRYDRQVESAQQETLRQNLEAYRHIGIDSLIREVTLQEKLHQLRTALYPDNTTPDIILQDIENILKKNDALRTLVHLRYQQESYRIQLNRTDFIDAHLFNKAETILNSSNSHIQQPLWITLSDVSLQLLEQHLRRLASPETEEYIVQRRLTGVLFAIVKAFEASANTGKIQHVYPAMISFIRKLSQRRGSSDTTDIAITDDVAIQQLDDVLVLMQSIIEANLENAETTQTPGQTTTTPVAL